MKCHCCKSQYYQLYENTFECNSCGHIHRNYKGDSVEYHKNQYRQIERRDRSEINENGEIQELFHEKRKDICNKRLDFVRKYLNKDYTCLDIGAGAGTYANTISSYVKNLECTELDKSLIAECERLGFQVYDVDFLNMKSDITYDIVSAWHVLEHVDNIDAFIKKCSEITEKYCIIEVPLLKSLSGQGRVRKLLDPSIGEYDGHAHYFSKNSFELAVNKHFSIVEIKEGVQSPALFAVLEKRND